MNAPTAEDILADARHRLGTTEGNEYAAVVAAADQDVPTWAHTLTNEWRRRMRIAAYDDVIVPVRVWQQAVYAATLERENRARLAEFEARGEPLVDAKQHAWSYRRWMQAMAVAGETEHICFVPEFGFIAVERALRAWLPYFHFYWISANNAAFLKASPAWPLTTSRRWALRDDKDSTRSVAVRRRLPNARADGRVGRLGGGRYLSAGREQRSFGDTRPYDAFVLHPSVFLHVLVCARDVGILDTFHDFAWIRLLANIIVDLRTVGRRDDVSRLFNALMRLRGSWQDAGAPTDADVDRSSSISRSGTDSEVHVLTSQRSGLLKWLVSSGFYFTHCCERPRWLNSAGIAYESARLRALVGTRRKPGYDWRDAFACNGFYIGPSTLRGAGNGCFSRIDVPTGRTIGFYAGRVVDVHDARLSGADAEYALSLNCNDRETEIDASDLRFSNFARFINQANDVDSVNVLFDYTGQVITIQPLRRGDELFTSYGEGGAFFQADGDDDDDDDDDTERSSSFASTSSTSSSSTIAQLPASNCRVNWVNTSLVDALSKLRAHPAETEVRDRRAVDDRPSVQVLAAGDRREFVFRNQGGYEVVFSAHPWRKARVIRKRQSNFDR